MKLPKTTLTLSEALQEFDVWITPTLGEIRDTQRFRQEMEAVVGVFERIGKATGQFRSEDDLRPDAIAESYMDSQTGCEVLQALAAVLFLVTGKSDNNAKCQLPIHLQQSLGWSMIPTARKKNGGSVVVEAKIPRVLDSERFMKVVAGLQEHPELQSKLLTAFITFVLSDKQQVSQLWAVGKSYFTLKTINKERDLLTPLVVFQVRGSVAASGGHDPEELLRNRLEEWGLLREVDFNLNDVIVAEPFGPVAPVLVEVQTEAPQQVESVEGVESAAEGGNESASEEANEREKTRAYDFVLPHKSPGWGPKIFVQSQFYAGDSGSVSHKNVDQTGKSRPAVRRIVTDARFIEYVDGAGYFASLNGDLRKLLAMETTATFIQVRTAAVRLRRELQEIGFLTPLDLQHAILRTDGAATAVRAILQSEGFVDAEITRRLDDSINRALVGVEGDRYVVSGQARETARRYLLLDTVCNRGARFNAGDDLKGHILVPGYGPFFGMPLTKLADEITTVAPSLAGDWAGGPSVILKDVEWLSKEGFVMLGR